MDVILPLALNNLFTYNVPEELTDTVSVGCRVVVQFGRKRFYSAIVAHVHHTRPTEYQTKAICVVLDPDPVVNPTQLKFWGWMSSYYMCCTGEILKAALPSGLKLESETQISPCPDTPPDTPLCFDEVMVLDLLKNKKSATIDAISKAIALKNPLAIINSLLEKRRVTVSEVVREKYKPKTEVYLDLGGDLADADFINGAYEMLSRSKKQQEAFMFYLKLHGQHKPREHEPFITKRKFVEQSGISTAVVDSLVERGIFAEIEVEVGRLQTGAGETQAIKQLSEAQDAALRAVESSFAVKQVVLLHGVTASGKTEVYIHLISKAIARGKQVLYLLPEIALTAQIINRLKHVFGNQVGIYHSRYGDAERVEVWKNILQPGQAGSYKIILGARSSIFLPFSNLGLIIVDEEHETSFKQFDPAPRYHARDAAVMLGKMHDAPVLLGTATPAVETYFNARSGKYGLVELFQRHSLVELPAITIVDIKDQTRKKLMRGHFTSVLTDKMNAALSRGEQVILFQNRRGFSPYIECNVCGNIPSCKHCDVTLTYHKFTSSLVCHYCGYTQPNPASCVACGSPNIETKGFGTEKIEDEVSLLFPGKKVARMDLDATRAKNAFSDLISRFENREIDILVGTQMVTKGLDFNNVSLVGILNADNMLNIPDFRAFERSFQLMTQVAGRAGRSTRRGEVVIQTSSTGHPILADVARNDFNNMMHMQLSERKQFGYPPFSRLVRITVRHRDQETVNQASNRLAEMLRRKFNQGVLGPEFPLVAKIQEYYLKNILVKLHEFAHLTEHKKYISMAVAATNMSPDFKSVDFVVNVDPY